MNVLGIHYGSSDAGVCVLAPGREPIAIALERIDRIKYSGEQTPGWRDTYPAKLRSLLQYCAAGLGAELADLKFDAIVHTAAAVGDDYLRSLLRPYSHPGTTFFRINHHLAHAAGAFYATPFDDAAVLVVDGDGDRPVGHVSASTSEKQSMYRATGNEITTIAKTYGSPDVPCGIGFAYDIVTYHLNFGALGEAGKTMGLASYGHETAEYDFPIYRRFADGEILMDPGFFHWPEWGQWGDKYDLEAGRAIIRSIPSRFGLVRQPGEELPSPAYSNMAFKVQKELESAMLYLAERLHKITGASRLCMSGGVALNCLANRRILDETPFEQVFVQPAASDTGLALGAALYGKHVLGGSTDRWTMTHAYLGRPYTEAEVERAIREADGIHAERCEPAGPDGHGPGRAPIAVRAAQLLAADKIVGWFQGGSEYGPRALGHRSILVDPRNPGNKDKLNLRVKKRESFRPFAPSVLLEHAREYFDLTVQGPFMILAAQATGKAARTVPATIHVDNTARVQTVTRADNGSYYDLIDEFYRLTGVPVVLNTSFNLAGEPIVETPADAIRSFLATHMDYLIIHDWLIRKEGT